MKKCHWLLVLLLALALAGPAPAQMGPVGGRGMGPGGGMGPRMYNPQTVVTVKGQVEKLEEVGAMGGGSQDMRHLGAILKTDQGSIMVHLGPAWYLDQQKLALKAGDALEVTGSKVTLNNQPAIIARDLTVNGKTTKLRDDQGFPLGRGMGPGSGMGPGRGQKGQ